MTRYIQQKDGPTEINVRDYTGDGSTVQFEITQNQTKNKIIVTLNGIVQEPTTDYNTQIIGVSTTVLFGVAPTIADQIQIKEMPI